MNTFTRTRTFQLTCFCLCLLCHTTAFAFYNPAAGRWLNRDPANEKGGINVFCFVNNNVLNAVDLYGLLESSRKQQIGTRYQDQDLLGHAAIVVVGGDYGFGPDNSGSGAPPLYTGGTTDGWGSTSTDPNHRDEWKLYPKSSGGRFRFDHLPCPCNATPARIQACADKVRDEWKNKSYIFLIQDCRSYVDDIIASCCISYWETGW